MAIGGCFAYEGRHGIQSRPTHSGIRVIPKIRVIRSLVRSLTSRWPLYRPIAALLIVLLAALPSPAAAADEPSEFCTTLFHFNIQYVAGVNRIEDAIVRESFEPLLRIYEAHPEWGADFEMQAYMVEVLARRHPAVLERFRALVASGQIELVMCHYSDQLVLAYPGEDLARSIEIGDRVLEQHGLKRCGVIFLQEGQTGPGVLAFLGARGYSVAVHARGSYDFFQPGDAPPLLYRDGEVLVVPTDSKRPGAPATLRWGRLGDGELVVAEGNPYEIKGGKFQYSPDKAKGFESDLAGRAAKGARILTITRYAEAVRKLGFEPEPIGPYLDTPWKGENGDNVFCWLGRQIAPYERDVEIASRNYALGRRLVALDALFGDAEQERRDRAWKYLLLAQVSDAAGWFPLPQEVAYADKMQDLCAQEAEALAREAIAARGGAPLAVRRGVIVPVPGAEPDPPLADAAPEPAVRATCGGRELATTWLRIAPDRWRLRVEVEVPTTEASAVDVVFPLFEPTVAYSPATREDQVVRVPIARLGVRRFHLALANGVIGLGRDWWVVKHCRRNHVACRIDAEAGDVRFRNDTAPAGSRIWWFDVVHGSDARALEIAAELNTAPVVVFEKQ